ncbi:hypothetical protein GOD45_29850 [Sinorhizobium medicae]|nr:hypothetical protein [Sinorhizobium medicae]
MEVDWVIPGAVTVVLEGAAVTAPATARHSPMLDNVYRDRKRPSPAQMRQSYNALEFLNASITSIRGERMTAAAI